MKTIKHLELGILKLKMLRQTETSLDASIKMLSPDFNMFSMGTIEQDYLWFLTEMFDDNQCKWISYYVYECEFGERDMEIILTTGEKFNLKTVKQLYKVLTT